MDVTRSTAVGLLREMNAGAVTAEEVTRAYLDRIGRLEGSIHAFLHQDVDVALARARDVDARRRAGQPVGALGGVDEHLALGGFLDAAGGVAGAFVEGFGADALQVVHLDARFLP